MSSWTRKMSLIGAAILAPLVLSWATNFCWSEARYLSDNEFKTSAIQTALANWRRLDESLADDLELLLSTENCCFVDRIPFRGIGVTVQTAPFREQLRNKPKVMDDFPFLYSACGDLIGNY